MYVNEAMTTAVVTCKPHTSLHDVAHLMWDADCGAIPVVDDAGKPIGIVTDRDIAMCAMLNHKPLWEIQAFTVMQKQHVHSCAQLDTIEHCLATMEKHEVRRLPVVDESGKLAGIISMSDALTLPKTGSRTNYRRVSFEDVISLLRKMSTRNIPAVCPDQSW